MHSKQSAGEEHVTKWKWIGLVSYGGLKVIEGSFAIQWCGAEVGRSVTIKIGYHYVYPTRLFTVNQGIPKLLLQLESRSEQMPIEGS